MHRPPPLRPRPLRPGPVRRAFAAAVLLAALAFAAGRTAPAHAQAPAPPPSLTADETAALLEGRGMGLARAAEASGLPGPRHVLELADSLALTPEQAATARALMRGVEGDARALGAEIVAAERALSALFGAERVDDAALAARVHEIARLRADLRLVHLRAHVAMREALAPAQVARYMALRHGAAAAAPPHGEGASRHHHRP